MRTIEYLVLTAIVSVGVTLAAFWVSDAISANFNSATERLERLG